jgi:hypothetical protein
LRLGLPFIAAEFPYGLRCSACDHAFQEGERYAVVPYAVASDGCPVTTAACITCLLDSRLERLGHAV